MKNENINQKYNSTASQNRVQKAGRNFLSGATWKIFEMGMRFVMRTVMLYALGTEYLGLTNLFSSILQVLNLAELGVGTAMVFAMYRPVEEGNHEELCGLLALYRKYYRIIGGVILAAGLAVTPFLPYLIKDGLPGELNLYILYYINLAATVLSYWMFAYRASILTANQRSDVINKVHLGVDLVKYMCQIAALVVFRSYYFYIAILLLSQLCSNVVTAIISRRLFPEDVPKGTLPKEKVKAINRKISDLFIGKIGATIVSSADSIVISAFIGLTVLGIYQNYFFIFTAIITMLTTLMTAATAGVGNSLITETKEKNYRDLKKITFLMLWLTCVCCSCLFSLIQPFITIWMGAENLLDIKIVVCLCLYFVIQILYLVFCLFKDAGGIWHEDRFRPFITALINLGMNLLMVNRLGLYGVVLSTVISMAFIGGPWLVRNLFTTIFDQEQMKDYLKYLGKMLGILIIVTVGTCWLAGLYSGAPVVTLVVRLVVCVIVADAGWLVMCRGMEEMRYWKGVGRKVIRRESLFVK